MGLVLLRQALYQRPYQRFERQFRYRLPKDKGGPKEGWMTKQAGAAGSPIDIKRTKASPWPPRLHYR